MIEMRCDYIHKLKTIHDKIAVQIVVDAAALFFFLLERTRALAIAHHVCECASCVFTTSFRSLMSRSMPVLRITTNESCCRALCAVHLCFSLADETESDQMQCLCFNFT